MPNVLVPKTRIETYKILACNNTVMLIILSQPETHTYTYYVMACSNTILLTILSQLETLIKRYIILAYLKYASRRHFAETKSSNVWYSVLAKMLSTCILVYIQYKERTVTYIVIALICVEFM
jgi:hypothetical protein